MARLIARRLLTSVLTLIVVSFVVFVMIALVPGDPAKILAGENSDPANVEFLRTSLGLDRPLLVRYADWLAGAVHGDFGNSLVSGQAVTKVILGPLGVTVALVVLALLLSSVIGLVAGLWAASRPNRVVDRVVTVVSAVAIAVPPFWMGLLLVVFFALKWRLLPAVGYTPLLQDPAGWFQHLLLPALALGALPGAELALQLKESMGQQIRQPYFEVGLAKGLSRRAVMLKHALRNASIPIVTLIGYRAGQLIGGAVAVETAFALPGVGRVAVASVLGRDVNVLLGMVVVTTIVVVITNLLVDIAYGYLNPKLRD